MNHDIQSIIDQAVDKHCACSGTCAAKYSFKAGIDFCLSSEQLQRSVVEKVLEWINKNYSQALTSSGVWYGRGGDTVTTAELVDQFLEFKNKKDENNQ